MFPTFRPKRETLLEYSWLASGKVAPIHRVAKIISNLASAVVAVFIAETMISRDVYAEAGLDPDEAIKAARSNPNLHETRRWMAEKIMAFLAEQGMVTWYSKPIYGLAHLV